MGHIGQALLFKLEECLWFGMKTSKLFKLYKKKKETVKKNYIDHLSSFACLNSMLSLTIPLSVFVLDLTTPEQL